ncbi:futalosine hydrolase [Bacillus sp. FSL W7-1360]
MQSNPQTLIVVSVAAEKEAILAGLGRDDTFDVIIGGVGIAQAAAHTAKKLREKTYDRVINMGIAGGFENKAPVGSIVVATKIISPEIGAEAPDHFLTIDELGFGTHIFSSPKEEMTRISATLSKTNSVTTGAIISVMTATGTQETAQARLQAIPHVVAEAMEGYGVATAAALFHCPVFEIRAISNVVGIRDISTWRFKEAFAALTKAATALKELYKR